MTREKTSNPCEGFLGNMDIDAIDPPNDANARTYTQNYTYTKNNPLQKLKEEFATLEGSQRQLGRFILENSYHIHHLSISELSRQSGVSETTVVRLCRTLGFDGYKEFRLAMAEAVSAIRGQLVVGSDVPLNLSEGDDTSAIAKKVIQNNIDVLTELAKSLDAKEIERAVDVISSCRLMQIYGVGSSAGIALDACQRFIRAGISCTPILDSHMQIAAALQLTPQDVAFGISYSGTSRETVDALSAARSAGAITICMTTFPNSRITKEADIQLITPASTVPIPRETVASRIAQLAVIDIVCVLTVMRKSRDLAQYINHLEDALVNK
ncbi:MAG TPA: MurR/RpiR family transcriptional regulator, partial [Firmicutes bacterium]|nr:MurR/RpiR family transcriptional regulator [Bacillota bacterium]